jgi:hypothetical protein
VFLVLAAHHQVCNFGFQVLRDLHTFRFRRLAGFRLGWGRLQAGLAVVGFAEFALERVLEHAVTSFAYQIVRYFRSLKSPTFVSHSNEYGLGIRLVREEIAASVRRKRRKLLADIEETVISAIKGTNDYENQALYLLTGNDVDHLVAQISSAKTIFLVP